MTDTQATIYLKAKRDRSARNFHPWIFSGGVERAQGNPSAGDWVTVADSKGQALGQGFYNPDSRIRVRLLHFGTAAVSESDILRARISSAVRFRMNLYDAQCTDALRLINSEGDGLSGLIVDYYAGHLVIQPLARWLQTRLDDVVEWLRQACTDGLPLHSAQLRIEADAVRLEGMTLEGKSWTFDEVAPERVSILENGIAYAVDLQGGQKTGFFLDQRDNRSLVGRMSSGLRVLNLFCYTGGFTLAALKTGARQVVSVDSSGPALELLEENVSLNELSSSDSISLKEDVKRYLPKATENRERFDVVICDPPPFARRRDQVDKAARAYKDINRRAMGLIDNGYLFSFTCSPFIDERLFTQILFSAAKEDGCRVRVLSHLGPGSDHPVSLYHPEGAYLFGLLLHIER